MQQNCSFCCSLGYVPFRGGPGAKRPGSKVLNLSRSTSDEQATALESRKLQPNV